MRSLHHSTNHFEPLVRFHLHADIFAKSLYLSDQAEFDSDISDAKMNFEKEKAERPFSAGEYAAFNRNGLVCRSMNHDEVIVAMTSSQVRNINFFNFFEANVDVC